MNTFNGHQMFDCKNVSISVICLYQRWTFCRVRFRLAPRQYAALILGLLIYSYANAITIWIWECEISSRWWRGILIYWGLLLASVFWKKYKSWTFKITLWQWMDYGFNRITKKSKHSSNTTIYMFNNTAETSEAISCTEFFFCNLDCNWETKTKKMRWTKPAFRVKV